MLESYISDCLKFVCSVRLPLKLPKKPSSFWRAKMKRLTEQDLKKPGFVGTRQSSAGPAWGLLIWMMCQKNLSQHRRGNFGIIERKDSEGNMQSMKALNFTMKRHLEKNLHLYCCEREAKEAKLEKDFAAENKSAARIVARNAIHSLKRGGSAINMVVRDGNFYFIKTSLGTGFSACDCLFDSRNCFWHLWNWASTINGIGHKGPLQFIGSLGHYFTPGNLQSVLPRCAPWVMSISRGGASIPTVLGSSNIYQQNSVRCHGR